MSTDTILVIAYDEAVREAISRAVARDGRHVCKARDGYEALGIVGRTAPQLIIADVDLLGGDGFDLPCILRDRLPDAELILITGRHDLETFANAWRIGSFEVLSKPLDLTELAQVAAKALVARRLRRDGYTVAPEPDDASRSLVGESTRMVDVYRRITYYAPSDVTVLVHGETGTGKELVAQSIYRRSRRSGGPFIAVNLGSVAPTLAESELFGHVKGAFTGAHRDRRGYFEMADRGTIFLDEIGEASAVLQVKLLRVIQEGVFWPVGGDSERNTDIRIIAATNRDLRRMVGRGEFREDLYYRLAVAMIFVPPLRDRLDDLDVLTSHLLRRLARKHSVKVPVIADDAREGMRMHCWPGNVRELESCLERGLLRARGGVIRWEDLEVDISHDVIHRESPNEATTDNRRSAGSPLAHGLNATGSSNSNLLTLQALQRDHIRKALRRSGGNLTQAARLLGIPRTTLQSRLKALGIERSGQLR